MSLREMLKVPPQSRYVKTFVIGDIHGMYGTYMDIMRSISPQDRLIILGDVIDRGAGGIRIIQDILKRQQDRKNNPEIIFLLGNHEMQFLDTIGIMGVNRLQKEIFEKIIRWYEKKPNSDFYDDERIARSLEQYGINNLYNPWENDISDLEKQIGLSEPELNAVSTWLNDNKGNKTIFDFLELRNKDKKQILEFLKSSYVVFYMFVNGKKYICAHAAPQTGIVFFEDMKNNKEGGFTYQDNRISREILSHILEARNKDANNAYIKAKKEGFTTICGHTPTENHKILIDDDKGFIRIDTGCGHGHVAALYCVDTCEVKYFEEKEKETKEAKKGKFER